MRNYVLPCRVASASSDGARLDFVAETIVKLAVTGSVSLSLDYHLAYFFMFLRQANPALICQSSI